ncbi:MAG: histidine--tRNA ligase [bacterium]|nr:histidine--tRNA ligase [bacterium]MDZ4284326.1 histidine--tRNA ligase [Patescibacteria group bacterium]
MHEKKREKLSTDPYKGVRDFYPEDERVQNYIFGVMRRVAESFGYSAYSASVLEPAELYRAKSGEELIGEQMYVFTDRGGREVALRPEMTPSLARLVAGRRRELALPLRWYTIANMFRYERPQKGRLREHWQLNVDYLGEGGVAAEAEIIEIAQRILLEFGLTQKQFSIKLNNRRIVPRVLEKLAADSGIALEPEKTAQLIALFDKRGKLEVEKYETALDEIVGSTLARVILDRYTDERVQETILATEEGKGFRELFEVLRARGIENIEHDPYLVRGFDYYTGMIFEVFDTGGENRRSLFGGGRYDDLTALFGVEGVRAVGFGMGDVTIRDVLETYQLFPKDLRSSSVAQLCVCPLDDRFFAEATTLAGSLRAAGVRTVVDYTSRKIGDQIKKAVKDGVPYILCFGEEEVKTKQYKIKELATGKETLLREHELARAIVQLHM